MTSASHERWLHPTFLGIGTPKAGTTSLFQLLEAHPDVRMSVDRKEIHYFDLHFDKGIEWYERFFPAGDGPAPAAVGEVTPHYLYDASAPRRIRSVPSIDRFVAVLRNPVDRAFSHYRFRLRQDNLKLSFEEFLDELPEAVSWGLYGGHLQPWMDEFDRDQLLLLEFERAFADPDATRRSLGAHLGIDADRFPSGVSTAANPGFAPRRRRLYASAVRNARWLRRHRLDRVITAAKRVGIVDAVKRADEDADVPSLSDETRSRLWEHFEDDVRRLEQLSGLDLSSWRPEVGRR